MSHVSDRLLYWLPRVLGVAFAIFLGVFALDVFGDEQGFWLTVLAFLIHLVPAAIILGVLIIAWRWEMLGAGLYVLAAGLYAAWAVPRQLILAAIVISGSLLVIAILFTVDWIERAKPHPVV